MAIAPADLTIECFIPGQDATDEKRAAMRDLIIQPRQPWFSAGERAYVEGALDGRFTSVASDRFFVAWRDGEPVTNVHVTTALAAPQIGLLSFVITAPSQRGKGIAPILMRDALTRFRASGGVCMHLGTDNPSAHRIYAACGFRDYNGHVMRYLTPANNEADFDSWYFAHTGRATVRLGNWGDQARIGLLYAAPHPWFVKDYPERIYCSPAIAHTRVGSILPALMINATERGGGLWVLENAAQRVVGAATLTRLDQTAQRHAPVIDFLVAPAYLDQAADLLQAALAAVGAAGGSWVHVYLASCDRVKAAIVRAAGFRHEATLAAQFQAGVDSFDLEIFVRSTP